MESVLPFKLKEEQKEEVKEEKVSIFNLAKDQNEVVDEEKRQKRMTFTFLVDGDKKLISLDSSVL